MVSNFEIQRINFHDLILLSFKIVMEMRSRLASNLAKSRPVKRDQSFK
jgi:hypothetical protein